MKRKLLSLLVLAAATQAGAQVSNDMITKDATSPDNVLSWGLGTQGQRYSPLSDINAKSIKRLAPVWSMSFGGEKQRGQEAQALIHDPEVLVLDEPTNDLDVVTLELLEEMLGGYKGTLLLIFFLKSTMQAPNALASAAFAISRACAAYIFPTPPDERSMLIVVYIK